ncbi:MAG: Eco57I restriction-modification methylase domain-containing protein [Phycisphaerales bacterium]|nr:Eco57I restriction-modification methylase domain-containing protein [Phycisphaerales bacterium]
MANLSADEVFTPPKLASAMLDILPQDLFRRPDTTFLDPVCKSGVFPREIARRLNEGLKDQMPDDQARINHILTKQVFGLAITELTASLSRRSVYCSKKADGKFSIVTSFTKSDGNVRLPTTQHRWNKNGRCQACGANRAEYERDDSREAYAYPFIHGIDPAEVFKVKFDVIIGNPPYQLSDGGFGKSASPIYHHFVMQAKKLEPRYLVMITPSRWFGGGKGLDSFRKEMLNDDRISHLFDFPKLYDGFPGVKIRGGVSYFLWNRDHRGMCSVQTMWDSKPLGPEMTRPLNAYDVFVRRNEAISILEKVRSFRIQGQPEMTLDKRVSSRKPFGLPTNYHGSPSSKSLRQAIKFYGSQRITWIERSDIQVNIEWIDQWKVLLTRLQGTSSAVETQFVSNPLVIEPGQACSETYLVAGRFSNQRDALNFATYLRTRFVRFLVSLRKVTQDATRDVYSFVPDVPVDREWTDEELYQRYGLNEEEISLIESVVRPLHASDREGRDEAGEDE